MTYSFKDTQRLLQDPFVHRLLILEPGASFRTVRKLVEPLAYLAFVHPRRKFTFGRDPVTGARLCRRVE